LGGRQKIEDIYAGINVMEVAELRTAITELLARVERIRDWL